MDTYSILKNASKRFYYSAMTFPKEVRDDVVTLYAFCRSVDNIADEEGKVEAKRQKLKIFKDEFYSALETGKSENELLLGFTDLMKSKGIERELPEAMFDSIEQDIDGFEFQTQKELEKYVYGVAGVVGIMMCKVLDLDPKSYDLANKFGYSFQWSNMTRDIAEDWNMGRMYFPREHLNKFGLKDLSFETAKVNEENFKKFIKYEIEVYQKFYDEGVEGLKFIPKKYLAAIKTAADIDLWTIEQIKKNPMVIYEKKVKPSNTRVIYRGLKNFVEMQL